LTFTAQFNEQHRQAEGVDSAKLQAARQVIRPEKEQEMTQHLQSAYGKRFDSKILTQSRKDVAGMLAEESEPVSILQKLRQTYAQQDKRHHTKERDQER